MTRESTITYDQVTAAATIIEAAGNKPTARAVREALGNGSMTTVLKHLQQRSAGKPNVAHIVNDTTTPAIARAIAAEIAAQVQTATKAAEAALTELQAETDAVIKESEDRGRDVEKFMDETEGLKKTLAILGGKTEQILDDLGETRYRLEQTAAALNRAEVRLEAMPDLHAEILRLRNALDAESKDKAAAELKAAVLAAKLEPRKSKADVTT